ncbi:MAG: sulfatase [Christensenellales bacterium]|jgi:arylsulfatase A-like enzyme
MSKQKNVLVIFSDQQHKYALGKVNPQYITPNLDRLCDEGVLFESGYSNNPVCGPYRGNLMTGLYTSHCGVYNNGDPLPEGVPTMASLLNDQNYETCFVGKWHLGGNGIGPIPENIRGSFKHFVAYQCYNGFDPNPPYNNKVAFYDEYDREHIYDKHRTDVTTDIAIDKLRLLNDSGKPFFAVVGYQAPHYPEQPSPEYAALYTGVTFAKDPNYQEVEPYTPTYSPTSPRPFELCPDFQRYGGNMDEYMRLYAGLVSQVDAGVGRIVQELKELGIYDDTLIIYTSDHGDMQGSHGLRNKCLPHEKSCGVPFLARLPGGVQGIRSDALVSGIDILPTALEVAGASTDFRCDGVSFLGHLTDGSAYSRDYVIAEYPLKSQSGYRWRMIRDKQYKLVVDCHSFKGLYLFDMINDPWEMDNIIDCDENAQIIARLTALLNENTAEMPMLD